jgi:hypothetical protein
MEIPAKSIISLSGLVFIVAPASFYQKLEKCRLMESAALLAYDAPTWNRTRSRTCGPQERQEIEK